jgi:signal transduction histidine kinase
MGLAISRTIVEAHGGRLLARNDAEGGAVFEFHLPAAARAGEESRNRRQA